MKSPIERLPELYTEWLDRCWTMMSSRFADASMPSKEVPPKAAGEGGSIKPPTKPPTKQ